MICTQEDDYTNECYDKGLARWIAKLSDNSTVFQDDGRPGLEIYSAWTRLKNYVKSNKLSIVSLGLEFKSHKEHKILPKHADGYFFCKSAMKLLDNSSTIMLYKIGHVKNYEIIIQQWKVPELLFIQSENRILDFSDRCVILNEKILEDGRNKY